MPAYNFKPEFARLVESGQKRQTIRRVRKRPTHIGETLSFYTGMRTKSCRLLKRASCESKDQITIEEQGVFINGRELSLKEITDLYLADGFFYGSEFMDFFRKQYGLPFYGEIIRW